MPTVPSTRPPAIVVLQSGGLGDVVLTSPLVTALKQAYPDRRIVLALDSAFQDLPALFPLPPDEVLALDLHLLGSLTPGKDLYKALRPVCARLASYPVEIFLGAAYRPRWLDFLVAAALNPERAIVSPAHHASDGPILQTVLAELDLAEVDCQSPDLPDGLGEPERYRMLAEFITGKSWSDHNWQVSEPARAAASKWLQQAGIEPGHYVFCFPFGNANVAIKAWPVDRFVAVLNQIAESEGLSILLAGSLAEGHDLHLAAGNISAPVNVLAGTPGDFPLVCGLLSQAKAFLGNDTGLMHLAQALGVPGVAVFGGGTWPAYRPWGAGVTGIIHSLPCFQCHWDCVFGDSICLDRIPVSTVTEELRACFKVPSREPRVVDTSRTDDPANDLIARASVRYRTLTADYHRMGNELLRIHAEAERRSSLLERINNEMIVLRGEAANK